jgi:5-methylcytosine-specific restriction endonuclease McrA
MSGEKKAMRKVFRDACFKRDGFRCAMCGMKSSKDKAEEELDAHHIISRTIMPHGGYTPLNGISLCPDCHEKAEEFHKTGKAVEGYSPDDLYKKINSSYEKAVKASKELYSRYML